MKEETIQAELRAAVYSYLYDHGYKITSKDKGELSKILKKVIEYREKTVVIERTDCKKCRAKNITKPSVKEKFNPDYIIKAEPKRVMNFDD